MEEIRRIRRLYGREHIRALVLLAVISNLLILAPSLHMMQMYNRVLVSHSIETLVAITFICVFALALYGLAEAARGRVSQRLANSYSLAVTERLFTAFSSSSSAPEAAGQTLRDFQTVRGFLASRSFSGLFDLPFVPFYLVVLCLAHWSIGLVTLAGALLLAWLGTMNSRASAPLQKTSRAAEAEAMAVAQSTLARSGDVRSLGLSANLSGWWMRKTDASFAAADEVARLSAQYYGFSRGARQAVQILLMAWSTFLVLDGDMSAGLIFVASMVSSKALAPIETLIGAWDTIAKARTAFAALEQVFASTQATDSKPALPAPSGHLSVEALVVGGDAAQKSGKPVINGVNFEVRPGEIVAVVGNSGAGKSLLARAIAGAIPVTSGAIRLDGAARDQWPDHQWGGAIGFVDQEIDLFPGTVAANIARFEADVAAGPIYLAAERAGVHDVILALPDGYTTRVGEGGLRLSSGQRKAIALARACYGGPKVLILDEPLTSLDDTRRQRLIARLLDAKSHGVAILLLSQQTDVIAHSDRAFLMRDGRLYRIARGSDQAAELTVEPAPPASAQVAADQAAQALRPTPAVRSRAARLKRAVG